VYMLRNKKFHWIATVPATFMSAVVTTYILQAPEGLKLSPSISQPIGIVIAIVLLAVFIVTAQKHKSVGAPEPA
jgi:tellurite resistance protein TehA-like permease|nr:carbon starvation protein A [Oceanispirochaeta sp.]